MSDNKDEERIIVNISEWVDRAKADPIAYIERQATEVFIAALAMAEPYAHQVFLKGGILMGVVYGSPRQTGDIDFTTIIEPEPGIAERLKEALDTNFPRAAAELGYPDLLCRVQSMRYFPKGEAFPKNDGPAVKLGIGYARRDSRQEPHWANGKAPDKLEVDISFKEPVGAIQIVQLADTNFHFRAYSLLDLMAEKLRALLQQEIRNRTRRQDIYDLDALLQRFTLDDEEKRRLLELLRIKCAARGVTASAEALSQPEIIRRAQIEWHTLALEIGTVPDFDACFARVDAFYRSLPW